ncbi:hypothetical protein [Streptomyces sp. NPDC001621]|uniref:hypothetical protein n=1 Tax=Streptomyces sp. NPDC001621 TaxID=3364594 RepID=UPI0036767234
MALGDGARGVEATVSSAVPGVPPGVWHGQGAEALELSGVVSAGAVDAAGGRLIPLAPSSRAAPDQAAEERLVAAAREASL